MRFFFLFYTFLFLSNTSYEQVVFTTSQVLSTAKNQPALQLQKRKLEFFKKTPHELPLFNRLEIRTQTHDFKLEEQQFTFRVRPNSRKERLGQRQLHLSTIQWHQEENRQVLLEGVKKRYNTCLILLFSKKRLKLMVSLETVYKELANAYEAVNDLEELLEAEEVQENFSVQFLDYQSTIDKSIRQTHYYMENKTSFILADSDFLTIEILKERLKKINPSTPLTNPYLALLNNQINLIDKSLQFELAKQKKWFSFGQVRYGSMSNAPFREIFSAALAFQLPIKGNSILKINGLELDKIDAENNWGVQSYAIQKELKVLARDLANWLDKHEKLSNSLALSREKYNKHTTIPTATPTILSLKIKAHLLKKDLALQEIEESIYQIYIDWLAITGKMIELPLINYLSMGLERF